MEAAEVLGAYVGSFVDALIASGVRNLVFAPGSRSTPIILTAAEREGMRLWRQIDERSAAFFALGMAKRREEPVALLCSSGTAAANFYPAVIEAYYDRVPLIVLTADRPHELRDSGAPQTIDQVHLYGGHVKWFVDMALPEADPAALRYARQVAARAVAHSLQRPAGPVHLNFPFRDPLVPQAPAKPQVQESRTGFPTAVSGRLTLDSDDLAELADELASRRRGLIVCGPTREPLAEGVVRLASRLGYPVLADPLSGLRYGPHDKTWVIDAYDAFLRDPELSVGQAPDIVLRFGAAPTSKVLNQFLAGDSQTRQIVVDGGAGWRDPTRMVRRFIHVDPVLLCESVTTSLPRDLADADRTWAKRWQRANERAKAAAAEQIRRFDTLFEGRVLYELGSLLPAGCTLYVGNSMPIRDMDAFLYNRDGTLFVYGNRGANGIDGVISSALGAAAEKAPAVLVIGDLSFYHDMNGLLAAAQHGIDLTIILVNNDGGGIFSFLPQAACERHFEPLFGTPHGLNFAPAVTMYGGKFTRVRDWDHFRTAVLEGLENGGLHVVEVSTERSSNRTMHQAVWEAVAAALRGREESCT